MDRKQTQLFIRRWLFYTTRDAFTQTFGWLSLIGSSAGGFFLGKFGLSVPADALVANFVGAIGGFIVGFGIYAVVGFFKTRQYMQPLTLSIADDIRSPDFTCDDQVCGYSVATIVRNRSDVHWKDCTAHVMNAPLHDGTSGPRFVEKFDLPPKTSKTIYIAYWFSREPPNSDDQDIGLTGPAAACWGGNVRRVPGNGTHLHIRIRSQDTASKDVHCRVWIDKTARKLRAGPLTD
ncbi:hypothetical protein [Paraburkholderia tropica]|uniref:hypothetical protein n=1 Tax=Paraburkholderia tropica TaxID=92647 RepID=UPI002AB73865|nr:hypothetical protein [Paraburkholderia tropica]